MNIGKRILTRRKEVGMTQEELAKIIGVTKATIHKYEVGAILRIDVEMIEKISSALKINPSMLTGWIECDSNISTEDLLIVLETLQTLTPIQMREVKKAISIIKTIC